MVSNVLRLVIVRYPYKVSHSKNEKQETKGQQHYCVCCHGYD
jgi:hypothetical protein